MISTAALYQGVDLSNINYVVMLEPPSSIYHLVQAMGRGGRNGKQACILIIIPTTWRPKFLPEADTSQALLEEFLTTENCRHLVLSSGMDNMMERCNLDEPNQISCDNCVRSSAYKPTWFVSDLPRSRKDSLPVAKVIQYKTVATEELSTLESVAQKQLATGVNLVRKEKVTQQEQLQNFKKGIVQFKSVCAICYADKLLSKQPLKGREVHSFDTCKQRFNFMDSRNAFFKLESNGSCYRCCLPDEICDRNEGSCSERYKDALLPLCWSVFWSSEYNEMFLGMRSCNAVRLAAEVIEASIGGNKGI